MKSLPFLLVGTVLFGAFSVQADGRKPTKVKASATVSKLTPVNVCPMTGESSKGSKLAMTYKKYDVHFCCPGCDTSFQRLSGPAKDQKIASALKVQKSAKS